MSQSEDSESAPYPDFYGFAENPFNGTPDLRFLYLSKNHRECLDSILAGIKERKEFISLLGDAGTGKTVLLYRLMKELERDFKPVFISSYYGITSRDLLRRIDPVLGPPPAVEDKLPDAPHAHKVDWEPGRRVVFIDEAQNLTREVLEDLQTVSESNSGGTFPQMIFAGHPEFETEIGSETL